MIWCKWVFVIVVNAFLSDFKALIDCTEKAIFELPFASVFIMQIDSFFTWQVLHEDSFWNKDTRATRKWPASAI